MNRSIIMLQDRTWLLELQQLERKARKTKNKETRFALFQQIADVYADKEEFNEAFRLYLEVLNVAQKMENPKRECDAYIDLALTTYNLNMIGTAVDFYEKSIAIAQKIGDSTLESRTSGRLGLLNARIGNLDLAIERIEQANNAANIAKNKRALVIEEWQTHGTNQKDSTIRSAISSPAIKSLSETSNEITRTDHERMVLIYGSLGLSVLGLIVYLFTREVAVAAAMNVPIVATIGRGLFSK